MSETTEGAALDDGLNVAVEIPASPEQHVDQAERQFSKRADKRIAELLAKNAGNRNRADRAEAANSALEGRLAALERASSAATTEVNASRLDATKRELRAAHDAGDTDAVIAAQVKLAEAAAELRVPRPAAAETQRPAAPVETDVMRDWRDQNEWFSTNKAMRDMALAFHTDALSRGHAVETPAYFAHIDAGMRAALPDKFTEEANDEPEAVTPPAQTRQPAAAPAPRRNVPGAAPNTPRTIRLTPDQLESAKVFGITPQQYAAQLAKGL